MKWQRGHIFQVGVPGLHRDEALAPSISSQWLPLVCYGIFASVWIIFLAYPIQYHTLPFSSDDLIAQSSAATVQGHSYGRRTLGDPEAGHVSRRYFCGRKQLTSDASWGFGAFSFSFLLLEISCLMRLVPDTFVLFSFSCELFSCFRGLIGGRGLSSSPLINLS